MTRHAHHAGYPVGNYLHSATMAWQQNREIGNGKADSLDVVDGSASGLPGRCVVVGILTATVARGNCYELQQERRRSLRTERAALRGSQSQGIGAALPYGYLLFKDSDCACCARELLSVTGKNRNGKAAHDWGASSI